MDYVPNQNGKVLEETVAGFNSDDVKTTLRCLRITNAEYYEWFWILRRHIQVGRLPF